MNHQNSGKTFTKRWSYEETGEDSMVRWRNMRSTGSEGGPPYDSRDTQMEMHMVYEVGGTRPNRTLEAERQQRTQMPQGDS